MNTGQRKAAFTDTHYLFWPSRPSHSCAACRNQRGSAGTHWPTLHSAAFHTVLITRTWPALSLSAVAAQSQACGRFTEDMTRTLCIILIGSRQEEQHFAAGNLDPEYFIIYWTNLSFVHPSIIWYTVVSQRSPGANSNTHTLSKGRENSLDRSSFHRRTMILFTLTFIPRGSSPSLPSLFEHR